MMQTKTAIIDKIAAFLETIIGARLSIYSTVYDCVE